MGAAKRMNPGGIILAFDCAGAVCSVVLWRQDGVLARRAHAARHGQAEILLPMIEATLGDAAIGYGGLAAIATTVGPGSFTGLRAGLAAARGLALATGLKAVGVSTLAAAAHATALGERRGRTILAAIDSRRTEIFLQAFDQHLAALAAPVVLTPEDAAAASPSGALLLAGDGAAPVLAALQAKGRDAMPAASAGATDAAVVAMLAARQLAQSGEPPPLSPLYLRAPDITPQPAGKAAPRR